MHLWAYSRGCPPRTGFTLLPPATDPLPYHQPCDQVLPHPRQSLLLPTLLPRSRRSITNGSWPVNGVQDSPLRHPLPMALSRTFHYAKCQDGVPIDFAAVVRRLAGLMGVVDVVDVIHIHVHASLGVTWSAIARRAQIPGHRGKDGMRVMSRWMEGDS